MPSSDFGFFEWVKFILNNYGELFLKGTGQTMLVALTGTVIGFIIGLLVAILRTIPIRSKAVWVEKFLLKFLSFLLGIYIEVFRGTPMIVQAMVIYYGSMLAGFHMDVLFAAVFIVSINTGSYMAEIIRGGIISVDKGQKEAAHAIGMTHWQSMIYVVLPQAVRNIMPSIGNEFVVNIKDSSVLNVISVNELYFMSKSAAGRYARYFEVFFITACIYLFLTFTVTRILRLIEKKMDGKSSYTIHGSQTAHRSAITPPAPPPLGGERPEVGGFTSAGHGCALRDDKTEPRRRKASERWGLRREQGATMPCTTTESPEGGDVLG